MNRATPYRSVELFTGAGGLALGVAKAGFEHEAVIEWNHDVCESLRANSHRLAPMRDWPIHEIDVRRHDFSAHAGSAALMAKTLCVGYWL